MFHAVSQKHQQSIVQGCHLNVTAGQKQPKLPPIVLLPIGIQIVDGGQSPIGVSAFESIQVTAVARTSNLVLSQLHFAAHQSQIGLLIENQANGFQTGHQGAHTWTGLVGLKPAEIVAASSGGNFAVPPYAGLAHLAKRNNGIYFVSNQIGGHRAQKIVAVKEPG